MNRLCWWLADLLSKSLEAHDRDAVYGDLAECGETGSRGLREIVGLVVRRQLALWTYWRPWLALVGVVAPLGVLLSVISARMSDSSAIYLWLYANNWDTSLLGNAAFRHGLFYYALIFFLQYLALACWSWSSGFVLGSFSRRTILLNGVLFCFMLLYGELSSLPSYLGRWISLHRARDLNNNAAVFALTFYRVVFPLIVRAVLVIVPALWGMRQGLRTTTFPPLLRIILCTAAVATLVLMVRFPDPYRQPVALNTSPLQLLLYWPLGYWLSSATIRHERRTLAGS